MAKLLEFPSLNVRLSKRQQTQSPESIHRQILHRDRSDFCHGEATSQRSIVDGVGRKETVAEIHRLIDKQLEMLRGMLTPAQAVEYTALKTKVENKINELLKDFIHRHPRR